MSGHGRLTWIRFQLQWKMRFRKGGRCRRSEVERDPHYSNNFVRCGVGVEVICHSVGVEVICHSTFRSRYRFQKRIHVKIPHLLDPLQRYPHNCGVRNSNTGKNNLPAVFYVCCPSYHSPNFFFLIVILDEQTTHLWCVLGNHGLVWKSKLFSRT